MKIISTGLNDLPEVRRGAEALHFKDQPLPSWVLAVGQRVQLLHGHANGGHPVAASE